MTETQRKALEWWTENREPAMKDAILYCLEKYGPLCCFELEKKSEVLEVTTIDSKHQSVSGTINKLRNRNQVDYEWVEDLAGKVKDVRINPSSNRECEVYRILPKSEWTDAPVVSTAPRIIRECHDAISDALRELQSGTGITWPTRTKLEVAQEETETYLERHSS